MGKELAKSEVMNVRGESAKRPSQQVLFFPQGVVCCDRHSFAQELGRCAEIEGESAKMGSGEGGEVGQRVRWSVGGRRGVEKHVPHVDGQRLDPEPERWSSATAGIKLLRTRQSSAHEKSLDP